MHYDFSLLSINICVTIFVVNLSLLVSLAALPHLFGPSEKSPNSSGMNAYKNCASKPFRMNTCGAKDLKYLCFQTLTKNRG